MNIDLEIYFDRRIILTRFKDFEDLKETIQEELDRYSFLGDLRVGNYDFKFDFDNDFEDYSIIIEIYKDNKLFVDLQLWYAITRIGERIIIESSFEEV